MNYPDITALMVAVWLNALAGVIAAGLIYLQKKYKTIPTAAAEIMFSVWMIILGSVLPLAAIHSQSITNRAGMALVAGLALLGLGLQLLKLIYKSRRSLWPYAVALNLAYPPLLLWSLS